MGETIYLDCVTSCSGEDCIQCYMDLEDFLANCPCHENCPDDCPCPEFDCDLIGFGACQDPDTNLETIFVSLAA